MDSILHMKIAANPEMVSETLSQIAVSYIPFVEKKSGLWYGEYTLLIQGKSLTADIWLDNDDLSFDFLSAEIQNALMNDLSETEFLQLFSSLQPYQMYWMKDDINVIRTSPIAKNPDDESDVI